MLIIINILPDFSVVMVYPSIAVRLQFLFTNGIFSEGAAMFSKLRIINSTLSDYTRARHTRRERVSSTMDGRLKSIHGAWIPAQICLEQICINPKGVRQDCLT